MKLILELSKPMMENVTKFHEKKMSRHFSTSTRSGVNFRPFTPPMHNGDKLWNSIDVIDKHLCYGERNWQFTKLPLYVFYGISHPFVAKSIYRQGVYYQKKLG